SPCPSPSLACSARVPACSCVRLQTVACRPVPRSVETQQLRTFSPCLPSSLRRNRPSTHLQHALEPTLSRTLGTPCSGAAPITVELAAQVERAPRPTPHNARTPNCKARRNRSGTRRGA